MLPTRNSHAHMSATTSTILVLMLFAVVLAPLALVGTRHASGKFSIAYVAGLVVIAFCGTGLFMPGNLASIEAAPVAIGANQATQCARVLQLIGESGVTVDRTDPSSPKLIGRGIESLPQEVRDVIIACAKTVPRSEK